MKAAIHLLLTGALVAHVVQPAAAGQSNALAEAFDVIKFEVCDRELYKSSSGRSIAHVYFPWRGLGSGVLIGDPKQKQCSFLWHGGRAYHVKGSPEELVEELTAFGVRVLILDLKKGPTDE